MQKSFFDEGFIVQTKNKKASRSGTFVDNMKLPVHRWLRFSAGFSAQWAEQILSTFDAKSVVLDPFAGSGTSLLASDMCGLKSFGIEAHPFIYKIAETKLLWSSNALDLLSFSNKVISVHIPVKSHIESGTCRTARGRKSAVVGIVP